MFSLRVLPFFLVSFSVMTMSPVNARAADMQTTQPQTALPRVLVLATGGTISGKADARSAIGYDAGAVTGEQLIAGVPGVEKLARLKVEQISNIASQNMNSQVWFRLAERIHEAFARNEADAVVITHGTDTMEETAFFLDTVIGESHPVVLTGAMRPSTAISADGPANMYEAVKVAVSPQAHNRGVLVVLDDTVHAARWVSKTHTTALETFQSRNAGPVGTADPANVRFFGPPRIEVRLPLPQNHLLPKVEIIYAHADMDAAQIDEAVKAGARGIVIAGMGDGNVSQEALAGLDRAVKAGVIVVRSSRVGDGFVNRNVEVDDDQHGLVASFDLNPQKSRILLQLLLANGRNRPADIQSVFGAGY
ncbi:asparaginase [Acetobacter sicerae]|uniref:Asparaginase n=1 Tax=Acetobacter sicerae TaxID=85325 RepID=A0ABS8VVB2_9PROT|nr:asparaginase [Acetobacter sicerae]MCE0744119.1 asparaginase [Acetobacter sicerae]